MEPIAPSTTAAGRFIAKASDYVKHHERLVLVLVAAAVLWGLSGKIQDVIIRHDQRAYDNAAAARQAQADANVAAANQSAQSAAEYRQIAQQTQQENRRLEASILALAASLQQQQAADAKLPPPALAARIETLASLPAGTVTPAPGATFSVTQDGAVKVAQKLEEIPALQGTLSATQNEKANTEKALGAAVKHSGDLDAQILGLQSEIKKADTECKAEVKLVKAQAAKGKRKWFVVGYVAGLATRGILKFFGGV